MSVRAVRTASTGVVCGALVLSLLAPGLASDAGPALLIAAAVAGLPHGAVDALLLNGKGATSIARRAARLIGYATLAILAVALVLAFPGPGLAGLLVLSVAHFAEGEIAFDRLAGGPGSRPAALSIATSIVALPPAAHPEQVRAVLASLSPGLASLLLGGPGRLLLGSLAAGLAGWALLRARGRARSEVALVAALALLAPPLVAFAAWFAGWHAVRHLSRLVVLDGRQDAARHLLRAAVLPTLGGVALLLGVALFSGGPAPAVLLGLLALTAPHAVVVAHVVGRSGGTQIAADTLAS